MKRTHLILMGIIAIAIGVIISTAGDASSYENFSVAKNNAGSEYHIVGTLAKSKPLVYDPLKDPNFFSFHMIDAQGEQCQVVYHDNMPQDFERSEQVVVVGQYQNNLFEAKTILTKCPSKYVEKEIKITSN